MSSTIRAIMENPLPAVWHQKRLSYRTSLDEVIYCFHFLNREVFYNTLPVPEFEVKARCRDYWGYCFGYGADDHKSNVVIRLSDKWYCRQWFITTLAHEMVHQYQWDVIGKERIKRGLQPLISHGPTFFVFREHLANHGISLKTSHSTQKWFKHQNLFKC